LVVSHAQYQLQNRKPIFSVQKITDEINTGKETPLKPWAVREVLKHDMGLSYKKLKYGEIQANT
jgi:transposase